MSVQDFLKNVIYRELTDFTTLNFYKILNENRTFTFKNRLYKYFSHKYNFTWRNERSIEVPIIYDIVQKNKGKRILEIGNVLAHYYKIKHDVLDKYEIEPGVINEDVASYKNGTYDLIVSVSTFEHVGWDEKPRERDKFKKAISNLKHLLNKNGKIVFTIPFGYNKDIDRIVRKSEVRFDESIFMKRISNINTWQQTDYNGVKGTKYNFPYNNANAIMVATVYK